MSSASDKRLKTSRLLYAASLWIIVVATFAHTLSFPLIVSYDGMEYVHLAHVVLSPLFCTGWNYFRTPLFPAVLKVVFAVTGEQPYSVLLINSALGLAATLLLGTVVRRVAGNLAGAITLLIVGFYPVLVGYEHLLLSEAGTFFFLALLSWTLVVARGKKGTASLAVAAGLALILGAGYYWRPNLMYLAPLVAILYFLLSICADGLRPYKETFRSPQLRTCVAGALLILAGTWLLTYPWRRSASSHLANQEETILDLGIYKQAIIPTSDPVLGSLRNDYVKIIGLNSKSGHLSIDGISFGDNQDFPNSMSLVIKKLGARYIIEEYPGRYLTGVVRSFAFLMGVRGYRDIDDESNNYTHSVLTLWSPNETLDHAIGWSSSFTRFAIPQYSGPSLYGRFLANLQPLYKPIVLIASVSSIVLLAYGAWTGDAVAIALSSIPLFFLLLHALTLFCEIRYAFPTYPLSMANMVILGAYAGRKVNRNRTLSRSQVGDNGVSH